MKTRKFFSPALLAMVIALAALVAGCGTYQVQGTYKVGPSIDQQAPTQVVDANGNVRTKPPENATVDLLGLGDVRFGQRSFQGAGTLSTPAKQVVIGEKRTVREETYQDTRGCPDKSQIKEVKTGDVKRTEVYSRIENHPAETVGLNTTLNADDGPGTKLVGKTIDTAGNLGSTALLGISFPKNKGDNISQNVSGVSNAETGPVTAKTGPIKNINDNYNKNTNPIDINIKNSAKAEADARSKSGAKVIINDP